MFRILVLLLSLFTFPAHAFPADEPAYEEITVFLNVAGLGGKEVEAVILDEDAFLSITDVFTYLKIKNKVSADLDSVSGFFINENVNYIIDLNKNQISLDGKEFKLDSNELIKTPLGLYLKSNVFGEVFGLHCTFNIRSLSVQLATKLDLPVIREKRQELMRTNASKLKREIIADTIVKRRYAGFNAGTFDWFLSSRQQDGNQDSRLSMKIGTVVLGGETNVSLNYDSQRKLSLSEQQYQWRYVNNDEKLFKQVTLGKISPVTTASVFAPVVGVRITNTPTTYRRSFDTYTFSDYTEPDWTVELYVNNILLDYVKADAAGFFTFRIPLLYGNSNVKLRFFGPWGEERISEKTINVPYNFLPGGEMEYNISAGMLEDGKQSRYSRADIKYGVTKGITMGTGAEYISSVSSGTPLPFVNSSIRLASNLLLTADYMYNVRANALLNYRLPSNFLLELNYISYKKGQTVINGGFLEERKAMISKPFRTNRFSGFSRLTFNQLIYPGTKQTFADLLISGAVKGVSASVTTFASVMSRSQMNVLSNLAMTFQMPSKMTLRAQMQYAYRYRNVNELRFELEKQIFSRGLVNIEYSNNLNHKTQNLALGLRFDLNFSRVSVAARHSQDRFIFSQSFSGGLIHDTKMQQPNFNNRSNVGRGGLVIYPFLDINANNRRDTNEPKIEGLQVKINGGRTQKNTRDTTITVLDLEPYANYLLELNTSNFDNIAWQLKKYDYQVTIEPNTVKLIEVPVKVSGEVSGMIYASTDDKKGQGRILINFFRDGKPAGRTISETDGYFTFLGLTPGTYTAEVDSAQLVKLKAMASPASFSFNIQPSFEGDVVSDVEFKLQDADYTRAPFLNLNPAQALKITTRANELSPVKLVAIKFPDNRKKTVGYRYAKPLVHNFLIIASAFGDKSQADLIQKTLSDRYGYPVRVNTSGSLSYQLVIEGFETKEDANFLLPELSVYGFRGLYVTPVRKMIGKPNVTAARETNPTSRDDAMYFSIVVGGASDETGIEAEQERILKLLRYTSFPIKQNGVYKLILTGFTTRQLAEDAYQKLLSAGVRPGYIASYKKNYNTKP